jgi:hypothetical protein
MLYIRKVTFDQVLKQFWLEHPLDATHEKNTNQEAEELLIIAEKLFHEWSSVLLDRQDILHTILPWHLGCNGKMTLVPKSGLTVQQTVKRLIKIQDIYSQENIVCSHKVAKMKHSEFTPLFLSTQPIFHEDYSEINIPGNLFHLDGLHRMVSWEFHGMLKENVQVQAYIAGKLNYNSRN